MYTHAHTHTRGGVEEDWGGVRSPVECVLCCTRCAALFACLAENNMQIMQLFLLSLPLAQRLCVGVQVCVCVCVAGAT